MDEKETLYIKEDENSGVKWVPIEKVENKSEENWIKENIYAKLNQKLRGQKNV